MLQENLKAPNFATDECSRWPESVFRITGITVQAPGIRVHDPGIGVHDGSESVFRMVRNTQLFSEP